MHDILKRNRDIFAGGLLILLGLVAAFQGYSYNIGTLQRMGPGFFPLSLGVIFLTLYIDLIGFSIIFPLGPDLLEYYLKLEGRSGMLGWLLAQMDSIAQTVGITASASA